MKIFPEIIWKPVSPVLYLYVPMKVSVHMKRREPEARLFRDLSGAIIGFSTANVREDIEASVRKYNHAHARHIVFSEEDFSVALNSIFTYKQSISWKSLDRIVSAIARRHG